jgi:hypothetical protein
MRQIVPRFRIISAPLYQPSQTPTKTRNQLAISIWTAPLARDHGETMSEGKVTLHR